MNQPDNLSEISKHIFANANLIKFDTLSAAVGPVIAKALQSYIETGKSLNITATRQIASVEDAFRTIKGLKIKKPVKVKGEYKDREVQEYVKDDLVIITKPKPKTVRTTVKSTTSTKTVKVVRHDVVVNGIECVETSVAPVSIYKLPAEYKYIFGYLLIKYAQQPESDFAKSIEAIADSESLESLETVSAIKARDDEKRITNDFVSASDKLHNAARTAVLTYCDSNIDLAKKKERTFCAFFYQLCIKVAIGRVFNKSAALYTVANFFEKFSITSFGYKNTDTVATYADLIDCIKRVILPARPVKPNKKKENVVVVPELEDDDSAELEDGSEENDP